MKAYLSDVFDSELPFPARLLYGVLADHTNKHGGCWIKMMTLERESGMSASTIQKYLDLLKEKGWLCFRNERNGGCSIPNLYHLHPGQHCCLEHLSKEEALELAFADFLRRYKTPKPSRQTPRSSGTLKEGTFSKESSLKDTESDRSAQIHTNRDLEQSRSDNATFIKQTNSAIQQIRDCLNTRNKQFGVKHEISLESASGIYLAGSGKDAPEILRIILAKTCNAPPSLKKGRYRGRYFRRIIQNEVAAEKSDGATAVSRRMEPSGLCRDSDEMFAVAEGGGEI
jgi:hypothetical protein